MRKGGNCKMNVEYVAVDKIKAYGNNAKLHPGWQIEQIKKSIQEFGFNDPIAIDSDGVIIEGHGRFLAATELGFDEVPVIVLSDMTDEKKRSYMLVHNKLTMNTGFDYDILMNELVELDIDMDQYGFECDEEEREYTIENKEYNPGEFDDEKFEYECSECGFRFNA